MSSICHDLEVMKNFTWNSDEKYAIINICDCIGENNVLQRNPNLSSFEIFNKMLTLIVVESGFVISWACLLQAIILSLWKKKNKIHIICQRKATLKTC